MTIGDLFVAIRPDVGAKFQDELARGTVAAGDKAGEQTGQRFTDRLGKAVTSRATVVGAAIGGLMGAGIEAGAKFEDQLRTINTVAKLSDEELGKVGDNIQALSRETGKTTDDLTAGFYDLVSAGVPADKAMKVLRDSAILATGALGTTGDAVDLVTSALNAYGLSADHSTRVTDIFAQAVADGKVTAAELGSSIANIAPIAAQAGVSLEELAAGYALLTAKGVPAAQASTQMRAAISALLTPNRQLNELQKQTNINFAEMARQEGLAATLEAIRKATNGNDEAFAKALGSVEALSYGLSVTGDNAGAAAAELKKIKAGADTGGVALGQYAEKSKSAAEQAKRLGATVQTFLQDVGGPGVQTLGPFLLMVNQLGPAFSGALSPAKLITGLVGGIVGTFASLVRNGAAIASAAVAGAAHGAAYAGSANAAEEGIGVIGTVRRTLGGALSGAWHAVATNPSVLAASGVAGAAAGGQYGLAFQAAAVVAIPAAGLAILQKGASMASDFLADTIGNGLTLDERVHAAAAAMGTATGTTAGAAFYDAWKGQTGEVFGPPLPMPDPAADAAAVEAIKARVAAVVTAATEGGRFSAQAFEKGWAGQSEAGGSGDPIVLAEKLRADAVIALFRDMGGSMRQLLGKKGSIIQDVEDGMDDLRWAIAHPDAWKRTRSALEEAMAEAQRALKRAIKNGQPEVVGAAQGTIAMIQAELDKLPPKARKTGKSTGTELISGAKEVDYAKGGANVASSFLGGITGMIYSAVGPNGVVTRALSTLGRRFVGSSPPPEGPLSRIDVGGANVGKAWRLPFVREIDAAIADAGALISGAPLGAVLRLTQGSFAPQSMGSIDAGGGSLRQDVYHHIDRESLENARAAGFDERKLASAFLAGIAREMTVNG